jgi:chaperonin GroEL (HSP60 family)
MSRCDRRHAVVKDLLAKAKKINTSEEIAQVGTISANGEKEIGGYIAEAMQKVGNEGVITVEEAKTAETELEVVEEGIVSGGGTALLRSSVILDIKGENDDQTAGINIIRKALQSLVRQIAENAGDEASIVVGKILDRTKRIGAIMPRRASSAT